MTFREIVLRYQNYDPSTGRFDLAREQQEYARMLGVHQSLVSRVRLGHLPFSRRIARGLADAFPAARADLERAVLPREWVT